MGDLNRGTGRTTRQIEAAVKSASAGVSTLFVSRNMLEASYAAHLLCVMVQPDKAARQSFQVHFPDAVIRFASQQGEPEKFFGWRGRIDFDHNAAPEVHATSIDWRRWRKWRDFADHVNANKEGSKDA